MMHTELLHHGCSRVAVIVVVVVVMDIFRWNCGNSCNVLRSCFDGGMSMVTIDPAMTNYRFEMILVLILRPSFLGGMTLVDIVAKTMNHGFEVILAFLAKAV